MTQLKINSTQVTALTEDGQYWRELKQAISDTSGFKRWVLERGLETKEPDVLLDTTVKLYLRQTLETLAY